MTLLRAQRSTSKRLYFALTAVFIGTGLLQLTMSWNQPHPTYYIHTDSVVYWGNAISLWDQGVFENVTQAPGGTALILAGFVAGGLGPWETLLIGYSLSHALSAVFAGLLVLRLGTRPSAAVLTAALIGCYPPLLNYSRQILSGPWFVATILAGLYLGLSSRRSVAIAGWTLFSFAVFVRTPGLAALLLILFALVFSRELRPLLPAAVAGATLMLALRVIAHLTCRFPFISTTDILTWIRPDGKH